MQIHNKADEDGTVYGRELELSGEEATKFFAMSKTEGRIEKKINDIMRFCEDNKARVHITDAYIYQSANKESRQNVCIGIEFSNEWHNRKIFIHVFRGRMVTRIEEIVPNDFRKHWRVSIKSNEYDNLCFFYRIFLNEDPVKTIEIEVK